MKKRIFILIGLLFLLVLAACGGEENVDSTNNGEDESKDASDKDTDKNGYEAFDGEFITILTGGASGVYFPLGGAISKIYQEAGATANSQSTAASATNATTVNQGEAEIALAMGDTVVDAFEGIDSFEEQGAQEDIRSIASLYTNFSQIVVTKKSGIRTVEDLKGKRVAVGAPASGTEISARRILSVYNMSYDDITVDYLSFAEGVEGMQNGNIDAVVFSSGIPNAGILELNTTEEIAIVEIEEDKILRMQEDYPAFFPAIVPQDTYDGMESDVSTVGVNNVLITHKDVSDDVVYAMTKAVFENLSELRDSHNAAEEIDITKALENLPAPLHPGAKKYFDEQGVTE